ncbi:MAG TPA: hypothetical protein VLJ37_00775 [bacterium]|nr:hypothetical protein [bacterium]
MTGKPSHRVDFQSPVSRGVFRILTKDLGFTAGQIDGARPDPIASDRFGVRACLDSGPKDGIVQTSELFSAATNAYNFNRFLGSLAKTNPFTVLDRDYDLSWLKLNEPGKEAYQVDSGKAADWKKLLLGDGTATGLLMSRWQLAPSPLHGRYDQVAKETVWETTPAVAQFARWALNSTEFGLLPVKDQLEIIDRFVEQIPFPNQKADQQIAMRELIRKDLRSAVAGGSRSFTATQKISLYTLTRGRALEAKGETKKARDLYELALGIDPQNETARKHLGIVLSKDKKTLAAGVEMLRQAYESGLRDPDLLAALAAGEAAEGNHARALERAADWAEAGFTDPSERTAFLPQVIAWAKEAHDPLAAEEIFLKAGNDLKEEDRKAVSDLLYGSNRTWTEGKTWRYERRLEWWIDAAERQMMRGNFVLARLVLDREEVLDRTFQTQEIPDYAYRGGSDQKFKERIEEDVVGRTKKVRERLDKWESYMEPQVRSMLEKAEASLILVTGKERDSLAKDIGKIEQTIASVEELDALTAPSVDISKMMEHQRAKARDGWANTDEVLQLLDSMEKDLTARPGAPKFQISQKIQGAREAIESGQPLGRVLFNLEKGLNSLMNGPKIRHTDVTHLIRDAKSKILGGYTHQNQALYEEGMRDLEALKRYAKLEQQKGQDFKAMLAQYPQNSYFIFRDPNDLSGLTEWEKMERTTWDSYASKYETDLNLPLNLKIAELERTDPARAAKYKAIRQDFWSTAVWNDGKGNRMTLRPGAPVKCGKNEVWDQECWNSVQGSHDPNFRTYDPSNPETVTDFREGTPVSMEDLNRRSDRWETLYKDPDASVSTLMGEVEQSRQENILAENEKSGNEAAKKAYQERMDLETSLQTLPEYVAFLKTYEVLLTKDPKDVDPELLKAGRDFLVKRSEVYKTFLKSEYDRLLDRYEFWDFNITSEQQSATIDQHLAALSQLNLDDPTAAAANIDALKAAAKDFYFIEESHAYMRLQKQEETVGEMYADDANPTSSMDLARDWEPDLYSDPVDPQSVTIADIEGRVEGFRTYGRTLDDIAFSRTIDAKIVMLRDMRKEYRKAENLKNLWLGDIKDEDFDRMIDHYKEIQTLWASGDPAQQRQARLSFIALENSRVSEVLRSKYENSAQFNHYVTGVVIVMAAAFTAGLAAELAGPFLVTWFGAEGAVWGGYAVNALVFTASHRFFDSALSGDWTSFTNIWNEPLDFLEEAAFNFGMFAFLGKAMKTYEAVFAARLGRGLVYQAGGFVWEGGAFQLYGFFQQNVQMALHGRWDSSKMFNAFKPEAFVDGFLFLGALKIGGVLSMPVTRPATEAARGWVEKVAPNYAQQAMEIEVQKSVQAIEDYVKKGKGSLEDLMAQHESALLKQRQFLEDLPEGVRNEQTYALNTQALANLRQFRSAYEQSVFKTVGLEGNKNPYGLREITNDGVLSYSSAKGVEMIQALQADPSVSSVKVHGNGLVVVRVIDPFGRETTIRFTADVRDAQIKKMQEAAKTPRPETEQEIPAAAPALAANAG